MSSEQEALLTRLVNVVVSTLLFIVNWVNTTAKNVAGRLFGLEPGRDNNLDDVINNGEEPSKEQFVKNIDQFVQKYPQLDLFFKDKKGYIKDMAQRAVELDDDPETCRKNILVSLHQQVIYCDDSGSMKREGRWEAQRKLAGRIARVTTRILPVGEKVGVFFINQNVADSSGVNPGQIDEVVGSIQPKGDTEIGTYLRSKILEPLVYSKIRSKSLEKPLLVSVITDGAPEPEDKSKFADVIKECREELERAKYPHESVKFLVGQVGSNKGAAKFLQTIKDSDEIADQVFVTTDQLDTKLAEYQANEKDLDRWLIMTLFAPIKGPETKKEL